MEQLAAGTVTAYLDFMITDSADKPLVISYFDRSEQVVRSIGSTLVMEGNMTYMHRKYKNEKNYDVYYSIIRKGNEKFTHGLAIATDISTGYLITTKTDLYKDLYYLLMNTYDLPLLEWWIPEIFSEMMRRNFVYLVNNNNVYGNLEHKVKKNGREITLKELVVYQLTVEEAGLKTLITYLFKMHRIWITEKPQKELEVANMDDYFKNYGKSIVDNLKAILEPVSGLNGKIELAAVNKKRLYPQQAAMCNGMYQYFRKKVADWVLFIMGTGTGKTIQALVAAEMIYVGKWLEQHPDKTLKDAYAEDGIINYRNIIMCPPHLCKKWKEELLKEIPYAKPVIIDSFSQLVKLHAAGKERVNGKEYYIVSKEFLKLSYQRIPTPRKQQYKRVEGFQCKDCGAIQSHRTNKCMFCDSENIKIVKTQFVREGLICPNCNRLVFPTNYRFDMEHLMDRDDIKTQPLKWYDMSSEKSSNQKCIYCGESLWMPYIKNINTEFGFERQPAWIRQTFWANQSKKSKITNWVLRGYESEAEEIYGEVLNSMDNSKGGCRKYSPSLYIKKYLKDYFDVFICDEIHKTKGGFTAQGNAFHHIRKVAKYTFGLTGTIAGGVAMDLFYLLFRLDPKRMIENGYTWDSIIRFSNDYGCIQTEYEAVGDIRMNACSRGKQIRQPKPLPGISPLLFSDFLLDKAVFLNIEDMSANMPPLYEMIKLCRPESRLEKLIHQEYDRVIKKIKSYEKKYHVDLSAMRNQFSMSYLDKPSGVEPIIDPQSGYVVVQPADNRLFFEQGNLLAKEKLLIDIVNKEMKEGRNCVVYCEYTQADSTNVLPRLHEILVKYCGLRENEVVIMNTGYPSAVNREEWMHKKAEEGMKILICNPRLCETGLDFCWEERGVIYNYPTLIFYQSGYSLFVMWQAAGRSWRLNQREECRTYYLAYENTVQQAILQVLGEKKAATSAIQGKFSADGLAAMAHGVDTQMRIAQIMSDMDHQTSSELQKMFDVINEQADSSFDKEQTMQLFSEMVTKIREKKECADFDSGTLFDMFEEMLNLNLAEKDEPQKNSFFFVMPQIERLASLTDKEADEIHEIRRKRRKRTKVYENCSLY